MSEYLYDELPSMESFEEVFDPVFYRPVPEDWFIAFTDVVNSTSAIEDGRYKQVNVAGAIGAMAISNIRSDMNFPFLFGGDGMIYLLPPSLLSATRSVLADTRRVVRDSFGLDLRVATVPVHEVYSAGATLEIAKLLVSDRYSQALISGEGVDLAERWVKSSESGSRYRLPQEEPITTRADFTGFTCRWKDIPSRSGETCSVIIKVFGDESQRKERLAAVMTAISRILGRVDEYHPLSLDLQQSASTRGELGVEASVHTRATRGLRFLLRMVRTRIEVAAVRFAFRRGKRLRRGVKDLSRVREDNIVSSDFRKFDGALKMVVSCAPGRRIELVTVLDQLARGGEIAYGIHVADRAIMTCLIHNGSGSEVHFIDAADGGYALASKSLKRQLATRTQ